VAEPFILELPRGLTYADDAWSARVVFALDAGEQLSSVARDLVFLLDGA
jgi:hypothetical protein